MEDVDCESKTGTDNLDGEDHVVETRVPFAASPTLHFSVGEEDKETMCRSKVVSPKRAGDRGCTSTAKEETHSQLSDLTMSVQEFYRTTEDEMEENEEVLMMLAQKFFSTDGRGGSGMMMMDGEGGSRRPSLNLGGRGGGGGEGEGEGEGEAIPDEVSMLDKRASQLVQQRVRAFFARNSAYERAMKLSRVIEDEEEESRYDNTNRPVWIAWYCFFVNLCVIIPYCIFRVPNAQLTQKLYTGFPLYQAMSTKQFSCALYFAVGSCAPLLVEHFLGSRSWAEFWGVATFFRRPQEKNEEEEAAAAAARRRRGDNSSSSSSIRGGRGGGMSGFLSRRMGSGNRGGGGSRRRADSISGESSDGSVETGKGVDTISRLSFVRIVGILSTVVPFSIILGFQEQLGTPPVGLYVAVFFWQYSTFSAVGTIFLCKYFPRLVELWGIKHFGQNFMVTGFTFFNIGLMLQIQCNLEQRDYMDGYLKAVPFQVASALVFFVYVGSLLHKIRRGELRSHPEDPLVSPIAMAALGIIGIFVAMLSLDYAIQLSPLSINLLETTVVQVCWHTLTKSIISIALSNLTVYLARLSIKRTRGALERVLEVSAKETPYEVPLHIDTGHGGDAEDRDRDEEEREGLHY